MKSLLLLVVLFSCLSGMAQLKPSPTRMSDRDLGLAYLQKSRSLKIAGWSLFGGGIILSTIGLNQTYDLFSSNSGETLSVIGSLMTIASVPCFIIGAKNKGRAEILLRNENMPISFKQGSPRNFPALALNIHL